MRIEIQVSEDRRTYTLSLDGGAPVPLDQFMLLTREGEKTRNIVFGPVGIIGRLLYGFYINSLRLGQGEMRDVLEEVAQDIRDARESRTVETDAILRRLM